MSYAVEREYMPTQRAALLTMLLLKQRHCTFEEAARLCGCGERNARYLLVRLGGILPLEYEPYGVRLMVLTDEG